MSITIELVYDGGNFDVGHYWTWYADNGLGLTATGHARNAVSGTKKAQKALARIQGIQADPPREINEEKEAEKQTSPGP